MSSNKETRTCVPNDERKCLQPDKSVVFDRFVPVLVVLLSFEFIRENGERLVDFLEHFFTLLVARISIRMNFFGFEKIRSFDLLLRCCSTDRQDRIQIERLFISSSIWWTFSRSPFTSSRTRIDDSRSFPSP